MNSFEGGLVDGKIYLSRELTQGLLAGSYLPQWTESICLCLSLSFFTSRAGLNSSDTGGSSERVIPREQWRWHCSHLVSTVSSPRDGLTRSHCVSSAKNFIKSNWVSPRSDRIGVQLCHLCQWSHFYSNRPKLFLVNWFLHRLQTTFRSNSDSELIERVGALWVKSSCGGTWLRFDVLFSETISAKILHIRRRRLIRSLLFSNLYSYICLLGFN